MNTTDTRLSAVSLQIWPAVIRQPDMAIRLRDATSEALNMTQGVHLSASVVRAGEACEILVTDAADFKRVIHQGDQRRLLSRMGLLMQVEL